MNLIKILLTLVLTAALVLTAPSCKQKPSDDPFANAVYTEDTSVGTGETSFKLEVSVLENTVIFTVSTDAKTVGEALLQNGIISGDEGPYGLYIKVVNGITADYDIDGSYWSFYINGEYAMSGVDQTEIDPSAVYKLEYTK